MSIRDILNRKESQGSGVNKLRDEIPVKKKNRTGEAKQIVGKGGKYFPTLGSDNVITKK